MSDFINDTLLFEPSKTVFLETKESSLIRQIDRLFFVQNKIIFFDRSLGRIAIFDENGKFSNSIHKIGKGPSEYIQSIDCFVDQINEQILLLCSIPQKIICFDYSGNFLRETSTDQLYDELAVQGENYYCSRPNITNGRLSGYTLDLIDKKMKFKNALLPKNSEPMNLPESRGKKLVFGSSCFFSRPFDDNIYQIIKGKSRIEYSINFNDYDYKKNQTTNDLATYGKNALNPKFIYTITDVIDNKRVLMFNTNLGIFIYNKSKKALIGYKGIMNTDLNFSLGEYVTTGNDNERVVFIKRPAMVKVAEQIISEKGDKNSQNEKFIKFAKQLREEDNPVLFVYKFKK